MPRLEGKRSHAGTYVILLIILALVVLVLLEYSGTVDLIPGFGR